MSRSARQLSPARRWSRIGVWAVLGVVLTLRYFHPPEPVEAGPPPWRGREPGRQFRRPPAYLPKPVAEVPTNLWRLQIEIAPSDVETLRGYHWNGRRGQRQVDRPEVRATVREGGEAYRNVAIHLKGAAGSFRPFDDKPALTLSFSKHMSGQRFHGYSKISLNNSVQDPSYLSDAISRELFIAAGVPVPAADHVTVLLNGRDLGLYVLTEGWGKPFLRRHFANVGGNLYDGGFVRDINSDLEVNSGDNPADHSDLQALVDAAAEADPRQRLARLDAVLDLERFFSFVAMEVMTCHWDGYALNRNNYRLFHNLDTDRMVFMPHGMDQMFGVFRSSPDSPILPMMQGRVAHAVLTTPGATRRYFDRLDQLRETVFIPERLTNRVHELSRRIRPTLAAYGPDLADQHDYHVRDLCDRILARARSVSEQLAEPRDPTPFDAQNVAVLADWAPRPSPRPAEDVRLDVADRDGRSVLRIVAGTNGYPVAWHTWARLESGNYRLEGNVQTHGVDQSGLVCVRLANMRNTGCGVSEGRWSDLAHRFAVYHPLVEVEFLCELRAPAGEAWFDRESLRLVRE